MTAAFRTSQGSPGSAPGRQPDGPADDPLWRALVVVVIGVASLLRILYCWKVELLPEEAYYWNYSRHLDLGYLDHPPMVAWLIRLGTLLFGDTTLGVRVGALGCAAVTAVFIFRLTRNAFGEAAALWAVAMTQVLPFFFLAGVLMTPDAPLTAAWAASLYFLERALVAGGRRAWLWAGLTLGLGLLSKYTIALLGGAGLLFLAFDPPARRWLRRWEPYAAVLIAAVVFTPVIVWNAGHEWASFAFQTSRRLAEAPRFTLHKLFGAAIILLTPTGFAAVVCALRIRRPSDRAGRFLAVAIWVPLAVFMAFSLRHEVKLDWMGAPFTAALPLMAAGLARARRARGTSAASPLRRFGTTAWGATLVALPLLYAAGWYQLVVGFPGVGYSQHTELLPIGWGQFGARIDALAAAARARYGDRLLVVGMDRYAIASERAFYSSDPSRAVADTSSWHLFDDTGLMYERWFPREQQIGRPLLLVAFDQRELEPGHLGPYVEALEPVETAMLEQRGYPVRRFYYRIAQGYRHPPAHWPERP